MTVKVSVSLPDDLGAYLARQSNASATVAEALRARMRDDDVRRAERRRSAETYAAWAREHGYNRLDDAAIASNELALRGHEW